MLGMLLVLGGMSCSDEANDPSGAGEGTGGEGGERGLGTGGRSTGGTSTGGGSDTGGSDAGGMGGGGMGGANPDPDPDPDPSSCEEGAEREVTCAKTGTHLQVCEEGEWVDVDDCSVVAFDDVNLSFAETYTGTSIRWNTGWTCNCASDDYDFNAYRVGGMLAFYFAPATAGGVAEQMVYKVLQPGDTIGPSSTFLRNTTTSAAMAWRSSLGVDGYLGFKFENPDTGEINYGYAHIVTGPDDGFPATLVSYAFNRLGEPITIPEP